MRSRFVVHGDSTGNRRMKFYLLPALALAVCVTVLLSVTVPPVSSMSPVYTTKNGGGGGRKSTAEQLG